MDVFKDSIELKAEDKQVVLKSFQKLANEKIKSEMMKKIIEEMKSEGMPIDRKYQNLISIKRNNLLRV